MKTKFKMDIIWVRLIILIFYTIDDDVTDNIEEISFVVDVSCVD
jgi:hypothetical protein